MTNRTATNFIVIHCSATRPSQDIGRAELDAMHRARGFDGIGYHYVIRRNGALELGRPLDQIGAHVQGFNRTSVGVCMVGGLDESGRPVEDGPGLFTDAQWRAAFDVVATLRSMYPRAHLVGHRDLSPDLDHDGVVERSEWLKTCPGFDVRTYFPV